MDEFVFYRTIIAPKYWNCFYFVTTVPMNRIMDGNNKLITINGRNAPFANLTVEVPSILNELTDKIIEKPVFTWRLNFPLYAINHTVIKIEWPDLFKPPIPLECWRYYERYRKKIHYSYQKETNIGAECESEREKVTKMGCGEAV